MQIIRIQVQSRNWENSTQSHKLELIPTYEPSSSDWQDPVFPCRYASSGSPSSSCKCTYGFKKKSKDVLLGEFNALFNAISKSEISRDRRGESAASTMSITSVNIRTGEGVELVIDRVIKHIMSLESFRRLDIRMNRRTQYVASLDQSALTAHLTELLSSSLHLFNIMSNRMTQDEFSLKLKNTKGHILQGD